MKIRRPVPDTARLFVSVDYDTLELRALAQVCLTLFGQSRMADALIAGRDLHLEVAAVILGRDYADVEAAYAAKDKDVENARDCAKVANFGFPGGLGADALVSFARKSYGVRLSKAQALELKAQWLAAWPEMRQYFAHVSQQVGLGDATLYSFADGLVRGGVGYCDGCNHYFQNLAAKGAKLALFDVAWECYVDRGTALYGTRPVAFIHDEILAEVDEQGPTDACERLAQVMCAAMARVIKGVPITASPALMARWFKKAKAVWKGDELVCWEP